MTQPSNPTPNALRRVRSPIEWKSCWLLSLASVSCIAVGLVQAQAPQVPADAEGIYERLERQEAEIQWLRTQLIGNSSVPTESSALSTPPQPQQQAMLPSYVESDQGIVSLPFVSAPEATATEMDTVLRRLETLEKNAARAGEEKKPTDGWTDMSTEKWTVKMGGHVQMDYINWADADSPPIPAQNYFEFRRLRLTAEGTGYGVYDFRLQMTLEPPTTGTTVAPVPDLGTPIGTPSIKDAYFSMNEIPLVGRMRIGNFFVPFGLEQVTNDTFNIFLERSIPTENIFCASRQVGLAQYNATDDRNITWSTGIFFDSNNDTEFLKKRIDDNQGLRASGRLTWLPYYDEPSNGRYLVHTGMGILYTKDNDQRVRFSARPQIHEGPRLIDSGTLNADEFTTGNLEFATVWGPFTLQSEAFVSNINMVTGSNVSIGGAYAHASYFLTGENRVYERFGQHGAQFGRNVPFTNFFAVPGAVGSGAWEMKARWSYLDLDPLNRGQYNDVTAGFNWYWSDRTRVMFDWIHPVTTADTTFGARNSDLIAMRFDFNW